MKAAWDRWVALWDHREAATSLAFVRVGVGVCLLFDFAMIARHGSVVGLLGPAEAGGWGAVLERSNVPLWYRFLPAEPASAWLLWGLLVLFAATFAAGLFTRTSSLVLMLLYAQAALIVPAGDRGIDMLLRNVLMLFAFSEAGAAWSLDAWRRTGRFVGDGRLVPAWPRHLLILQLVVMYFVAGIGKIGAGWTPMGGYTALFIILQDPAITRADFGFLVHPVLFAFTQLSTAVTVLWEYSAPLLLGVYWLRHTASRGGALRAWVLRWRPEWWWLSVGVVFHVLIAATLVLGIFPFAMLALYPAFVHPTDWPERCRPDATG